MKEVRSSEAAITERDYVSLVLSLFNVGKLSQSQQNCSGWEIGEGENRYAVASGEFIHHRSMRLGIWQEKRCLASK